MKWTPEQTEEIARLDRLGIEPKHIAKIACKRFGMPVTKSQIHGKLFYLRHGNKRTPDYTKSFGEHLREQRLKGEAARGRTYGHVAAPSGFAVGD